MAVARHHVHAHMEFTDKASDGSEDLPNDRLRCTECPYRTCAAQHRPLARARRLTSSQFPAMKIEAGVGGGQIDAYLGAIDFTVRDAFYGPTRSPSI